MTAIDIFKQSLSFYGRIFNKIIWISVALNLLPYLIQMVSPEAGKAGEPSTYASFIAFVSIVVMLFFVVFQMVLVDNFSQHQDDSYNNAISASFKVLPNFMLQSVVLGLIALVVIIFGVTIGQLVLPISEIQDSLDSGIFDPKMAIYIIPMLWVAYRLLLSQWYLVENRDDPISVIKQSFLHTGKNGLYFQGIALLIFLFIVNYSLSSLIGYMIALTPVISSFLIFILNAFTGPLFTIYMYRLFTVTKPQPETLDNEK